MVSHWILPDGIEQTLYIHLFFPIYLPDICYLIYMVNYSSLWNKTVGAEEVYKDIAHSKSLVRILSAMLIYSTFLTIFNQCDGFIDILFGGQWFTYCGLLYLLYPMNKRMIENTKFIIIPTLIILCLEVILFSLGILTYTVDLGSQQYGGVTRISTTIGAATGTAVILCFIGAMVLSLYNIKATYKLILGILSSVAIFFTASRGSSAVWLLYIGVYIYANYIYKSKLSKKISISMLAICGVLILNQFGVFDPLLDRQSQLSAESNLLTSRDELVDRAMVVARNSNYIGVGQAQVNRCKGLTEYVSSDNIVGVHNYYICTLAENGIMGLLLLIVFVLVMLKHLNYKNSLSFLIVLIFLVTFNTEPVFSYEEFCAPVFLIIMTCLKRNESTLYNNA